MADWSERRYLKEAGGQFAHFGLDVVSDLRQTAAFGAAALQFQAGLLEARLQSGHLPLVALSFDRGRERYLARQCVCARRKLDTPPDARTEGLDEPPAPALPAPLAVELIELSRLCPGTWGTAPPTDAAAWICWTCITSECAM